MESEIEMELVEEEVNSTPSQHLLFSTTAVILNELKSEITLYKLMAPLPFYSDLEKTTFSNPLVWWKALCGRFPLLSRRAQKVLALMGTSAPSERVFSSGGNVVTKSRASMHADTVANLILLKQSLAAAKAFELKKSQNAAKR